MPMQQSRQLAAIMFTDMVGYTALMQENEQLALQKRDLNKIIFEKALSKYHGKLLQYYGDGTMSIFTSAVNAIKSAIEMQTLSRQEKIDLRIGMHIGDVMTDDNGIYGDSVNVASRIESLAVPGSIFISEKLFDDVKNHEGISAKPLGFFELKNVKQPIQVYAISNEGVVVPSREAIKGKIRQTLNSIAVLPFASLSSDPENEYFCDGITEELLNVLAKIEGLQVTSRTSSFAFKGKTEDIREIAAKLNVQKVLEGSVRKSGLKVRITAQLINSADGYHLWSETYDRSLEDIFAVQDEIAREIANKLRLNLTEKEHARELVKVPTKNLDAYKKYLQGIHFWNKQTIQDIFRSLASFNEAIALEPEFANPYFEVTFINSFFTHAGIVTLEEGKRICTEATAKVSQIDPDSPWSHLSAGIVAFYFDWDFEKAEREFRKSLELNPNLANAYLFLGWLKLVLLQREQLPEIFKTAQRLDPVGGEVIAGAGEVFFLAGLLDESEYYCNEALNNDSHNMYAGIIKGIVTGFKGDWNSAEQMIQPIAVLAADFNLAIAFYGFACAKNGNIENAKALLLKLEKKHNTPDAPPLDHLIALLYIALGEKEKFYTYYESATDKRIASSLYYYNSPFLADVAGEERLIAIRTRLQLPV
ncbi:MAG: guanylate cyclase [Chitinophagales bacterium]|nr:guanylate cyclase [Chitinophagales bacterium]